MSKEISLHVETPRWALPNEVIPMSIAWPKDTEWDELHINPPENIVVHEFSNVEEIEYIPETNKYIVKKVFQTEKNSIENYIVISLSCPVPETTSKQVIINIRLMNQGIELEKEVGFLRVFRPHIRASIQPNARIVLSEEITSGKLPINIEVTGFGDIRVGLHSITRGQLHTENGDLKENLVVKFLRYLQTSNKGLEESKPFTQDSKPISLQFHPDLFQDIFRELESIVNRDISTDTNNFTVLNDEDLKQSIEMLKEIGSELEDWMYTFLYELLIDSGKKYPAETIEVDTKSTIDPSILVNANRLDLIVKYSDQIGNEYESDPISIPVHDERRNKQKHPYLKAGFIPQRYIVNQMKNVERYIFG